MDEILAAIKNQRWYFFENNDKIIFDSKTALIWANLEFFSYRKSATMYSSAKNYAEVKTLLNATNAQKFGGFGDWQIPTPEELWSFVEDKTFPYYSGKKWRIKTFSNWCVNYNGNLACKDLDNAGARASIYTTSNVNVILCSHALAENFSYSPQAVLEIFIQNNLTPKFNDAPANKIFANYKAGYQTPQPQAASENLDYKNLLKNYALDAVAQSPIQYYKAARKLSDEILEYLQRYEAAQAETIGEFTRMSLQLDEKYIDNPKLTAAENALMIERQKRLARRLQLGLEIVKDKILLLKAQAENFEERLEIINNGETYIREMAALESEPRASFPFLVENVAHIVNLAQAKIDFFVAHKDFVAAIIKAWAFWSGDYKIFKNNLREELANICRANSIDEEIYSAWYEDWRKLRFIIEEKFLPLVEFALAGNLLPDAALKILEILQAYKNAIDQFYLNHRKNIYLNYTFQSGGDLQEKFEAESNLFKLTAKFQRDLQEIIFAREKIEERIFLQRWAEVLLNIPFDAVTEFIHAKKIASVPAQILEQFDELRRQNFETYLTDSKAYSAALQKRETEYNALIFRMRKDLPKAKSEKKSG